MISQKRSKLRYCLKKFFGDKCYSTYILGIDDQYDSMPISIQCESLNSLKLRNPYKTVQDKFNANKNSLNTRPIILEIQFYCNRCHSFNNYINNFLFPMFYSMKFFCFMFLLLFYHKCQFCSVFLRTQNCLYFYRRFRDLQLPYSTQHFT